MGRAFIKKGVSVQTDATDRVVVCQHEVNLKTLSLSIPALWIGQ